MTHIHVWEDSEDSDSNQSNILEVHGNIGQNHVGNCVGSAESTNNMNNIRRTAVEIQEPVMSSNKILSIMDVRNYLDNNAMPPDWTRSSDPQEGLLLLKTHPENFNLQFIIQIQRSLQVNVSELVLVINIDIHI